MMFECIDKIYPSVSIDTVTGSICSFNDEYGGLLLKSCVSTFSDSRDSASLTACGINLWDEEWENGVIYSSGALINDNNYIRSKNYIPVLPNTVYYAKTLTVDGKIRCYDANKNIIKTDITAYGTFTTSNNCYFIKFYTASTTYNNDISINYPSTDTSYHAYNGNTYTFTFGQTLTGGSIDWKTGVVTSGGNTYPLGGVNLLTQQGVNNIFCDTGDTTVEYIKIV